MTQPTLTLHKSVPPDPIERIESEERADLALLRLVLCAALATAALAVVGALQF